MPREFEEESAAWNISRLRKGEVFTKSTLIPMNRTNADRIGEERERLVKLFSPVVARVKERKPAVLLSMHTTHAFTRSYDVIVSVSVLNEGRLKEEDEL